jgi:ribose/xylose/arabinose/galactoside ABC-type transport system permease subunit
MAFALLLGAVFGLAHGLLITRGSLDPRRQAPAWL